MKEFSNLLAPFITLLFTMSLDSGQYSQSFKHAVALPLLNKENMDPTQLNNYRPVSNLPFLSKFLEKAISEMLRQHMKEIDGIPKHHLAYLRKHRTETALLKVINDLLLSADHGEVTALCLFNLSTSFNTVDHQLQLTRLQGQFGVVGNLARHWIGFSHIYMVGPTLSHMVPLCLTSYLQRVRSHKAQFWVACSLCCTQLNMWT